jgi:hypothetical protein
MVETPLAVELNISKDEVEATKNRITFMLQVMKKNNLQEEYVTKIYEEWVSVAKRLKKGEEMINKTELGYADKSQMDSDQRFMKLMNLYTFLLSVLAYYDNFFKVTLSEEHHRRLHIAILEILH